MPSSTTKKNTKKKTTSSHSSSKLTGIEKIKITNADELKRYLPPHITTVHPKIWELTNRKTFYNWLHDNYSGYEIGAQHQIKQTYERELTTYQKLVRDFLQEDSPYRGLLLYHGLGVGKSCASIAISEANPTARKIIFISKAALDKNYREELLTCDGSADYIRKKHHWVFIKVANEHEKSLVDKLDLPREIITANEGAYIIDHNPTTKPNFDDLSDKHQLGLMTQITACINARFRFLHLDDPRITTRIKDNDFDNSVVIIDEAHGLINRITTGTGTGTFFYNHLMNAINVKIVLLSGTPLINKVHESAFLYNILRGYIPTLVYKIVPDFGRPIEWTTIKNHLQKHSQVDQVVIDKIKKQVKVTKNPDGFVSDPEGRGVIHKLATSVNFDVFKRLMHEEMDKLKNTTHFNKYIETFENNTCLPEDELEFQKVFFNPDLNRMRNTEVFKKRIAGLTSYYDLKADSEYPTLKPVNLVSLPMSDYQLAKYQSIRITEIEKEKRMMLRRRKNAEEVLMSSYRIGSRLYCNFVFPEEIGSPYEMDKVELFENLENILDPDSKSNLSAAEITEDEKAATNAKALTGKYLEVLKKESSKYLTGKSLTIYSPKYAAIIDLLMNTKGIALLYSQFISLIGLKTFALALEATGKYSQFIIKRDGNDYILDDDDNDMGGDGKLHYIYYAGDSKDKELRDIYRKVFNSQYDVLPPSCNKLRKQLEDKYGKGQNLQGDIIKLMMTTRSGTEGLNLANVRRVFVMEPYWQPVLIEQVIGRAVRKGSHLRLPPEDRNVEVFIFMVHITPQQLKTITSGAIRQDVATYAAASYNKLGKVVTTDEELYIISERKKDVITEAQGLIRESAFDCTLNYADNREKYPHMVCLNYNVKNRNLYESYLSTPGLSDTIDVVEVNQEYEIPVEYGKFRYPPGNGKYYYVVLKPQPGAKRFIYDESVIKLARAKPVGEMFVVNGKNKPKFYKKKK